MSRRLVALATVPFALVCLLGCQPRDTPLPVKVEPAAPEQQGDDIDFGEGDQLLRVEVEVEEGADGCPAIEVDLRWYGSDGVAAELRPDVEDAASEVYDVVLEDAELVPMAPLNLSVEPVGGGLCLGVQWLQARADDGAGFFAVAPHEDHRGVDTWVYAELLD